MFVVIHELAHIITPETGYTENFWKNMRKLLDKAIELGLYYNVDYSLEPTNYCGMDINSSLNKFFIYIDIIYLSIFIISAS